MENSKERRERLREERKKKSREDFAILISLIQYK